MDSLAPSRHPRNTSLLREILLGTLLLMGPVGLAVAYAPFNDWFDNTLTLTTSDQTPAVQTEPVLVLPDETPTPAAATATPSNAVPATPVPSTPTAAPPTPVPERTPPDDASTTPNVPGADRAFEVLDAADG